ncbi:hypothetical protein F5883DRAFT_1861 [Diaporthe sp. PMI_573]|nr:hypothetical protein F5883DRAFT_1861 [Diaporthaceae sp. PMI_573]
MDGLQRALRVPLTTTTPSTTHTQFESHHYHHPEHVIITSGCGTIDGGKRSKQVCFCFLVACLFSQSFYCLPRTFQLDVFPPSSFLTTPAAAAARLSRHLVTKLSHAPISDSTATTTPRVETLAEKETRRHPAKAGRQGLLMMMEGCLIILYSGFPGPFRLSCLSVYNLFFFLLFFFWDTSILSKTFSSFNSNAGPIPHTDPTTNFRFSRFFYFIVNILDFSELYSSAP